MQVYAHVQMYIYMHAGGGACANGALAVHLAIIERVGIQQILQRDVYVHMDMCVYLYVYLAIIERVGVQQVLLRPHVLGVNALHLYAQTCMHVRQGIYTPWGATRSICPSRVQF